MSSTTTSYSIDTSTLDNADTFDFEILNSSSPPADLEECLRVQRESFFPLETLCRAVKASENPLAIEELEQLLRITVQDGVSVFAREKSTRKIVSTAFGKMQSKPRPGIPGAFDAIAATFKQPEALVIMDFMIQVDAIVNLFEKYSTDTLYELTFVGTLPDYCGRHLAKDVSRVCLQVASQTPATAVTMMTTSPWTERIARGLKFEFLAQGKVGDVAVDFKNKEGKPYAELFENDPGYNLVGYPLTNSTDTKL